MSETLDDMTDATHYNQIVTLYEQMVEDIPQDERYDDPVQQAREILKNPRSDDATVAAVKFAAYSDEITDMHGIALWCADDVSDDVVRVLDVRFGEEPDRNIGDERTRVQMYHVRVFGETHQMGRVEFCEGDDMGFTAYPIDIAREDIQRRIEEFESANLPDESCNVDVKENAIGLDVPRFE